MSQTQPNIATLQTQFIPRASYYILNTTPKIGSAINELSADITPELQAVSYYTYNGIFLGTLKYTSSVGEKLDPNAPKPKPVSYRRIWYPGVSISPGVVKAPAGYAILLHDKNGYRIGWQRIDSPTFDVKTLTSYDLSEAEEEPADYSLKKDEVVSYCLIA